MASYLKPTSTKKTECNERLCSIHVSYLSHTVLANKFLQPCAGLGPSLGAQTCVEKCRKCGNMPASHGEGGPGTHSLEAHKDVSKCAAAHF
eukprot:515004-Amphidinium_carterae.1